MGKGTHHVSLEEYAAQHPQQEPPREAEAIKHEARSYTERRELREKIAGAKQGILQQLQQGNAPEAALYTAINAIGILTSDDEWAERCKGILDSVYSDLAQLSFLTDNAAIAISRQQELQRAYIDKTKRQLAREAKGCRKLLEAIEDAQNELEMLDIEAPRPPGKI